MTATPKRERAVLREVLRAVGSRPWCRLWRSNTGVSLSPDGRRVIAYGLPGSADLTGILHDGRRLEIECKSPRGRLSEMQRAFQRTIEKFGGVYIIARSADDALRQLAERGYRDGVGARSLPGD